jgi:hypothetical protein
MKRLAICILLCGAVIAGVGFYRGWFLVDQTRLQQDEKAAKREIDDLEKKADDLEKKAKEKVENLTGTDQD